MFVRPNNRNEKQIPAIPVSQPPLFPHRSVCSQMLLYSVVSAKPPQYLRKQNAMSVLSDPPRRSVPPQETFRQFKYSHRSTHCHLVDIQFPIRANCRFLLHLLSDSLLHRFSASPFPRFTKPVQAVSPTHPLPNSQRRCGEAKRGRNGWSRSPRTWNKQLQIPPLSLIAS